MCLFINRGVCSGPVSVLLIGSEAVMRIDQMTVAIRQELGIEIHGKAVRQLWSAIY